MDTTQHGLLKSEAKCRRNIILVVSQYDTDYFYSFDTVQCYTKKKYNIIQ